MIHDEISDILMIRQPPYNSFCDFDYLTIKHSRNKQGYNKNDNPQNYSLVNIYCFKVHDIKKCNQSAKK